MYPDESEYWWPHEDHSYTLVTDPMEQKQLLRTLWHIDIDVLAATAQTQGVDVTTTLEEFLTTPADELLIFTPDMIKLAQP